MPSPHGLIVPLSDAGNRGEEVWKGVVNLRGFPLGNHGQGHAFCARRPRVQSPTHDPTLKGSLGWSAPLGRTVVRAMVLGLHPLLLTSLPSG